MSSVSASAFRSPFVRSVVDVHNRSQLSLFHLYLSLPLPCPLPLLISLLHPFTPTSYHPPSQPIIPGNPSSHIVPHTLFPMFSPGLLMKFIHQHRAAQPHSNSRSRPLRSVLPRNRHATDFTAHLTTICLSTTGEARRGLEQLPRD
jgi:hypothetical protein